MDMQLMENAVKQLTDKAARAHDPTDAMKFSQAAVNAANAFCSVVYAVKQTKE